MSMIDSGEADLAMDLFQHSTSGLEEFPSVRPKPTLIVPEKNSSIPRKNLSLRHLSEHPLVLLQPSTTTRMIIDGVFRKNRPALKTETEASTYGEIKRCVSHGIGIGIIHDNWLEPKDRARFKALNCEKPIPHPAAKPVYSASKTLTPPENRFVEFRRFTSWKLDPLHA